MKACIGRREFVKRCVVTGAGIMAAPSLSRALETSTLQPKFDLYTVVGDRYFDNTLKAIDALGGMRKFVQHGKTIGILVNSPMHNPGSFTNPDVALALVKACLDAGAKQVYALNDISRRYWNRSKLADTMRSAIEQIRYSGETTDVIIEKSMLLVHEFRRLINRGTGRQPFRAGYYSSILRLRPTCTSGISGNWPIICATAR